MRADMFKVIVERPRTGRSWASKSKIRYDKCEERKHVSGHRLVMEHSGNTKHLNENLAPLKRYLHKQIGRRWDDVFSEICKHLDTGSTVKMHVREHLDDFILRKVRKAEDGTLMCMGIWGGETKVIDSWAELYVGPNDGIIKSTRKLCKKHGTTYIRNRPNRFGTRQEVSRPIKLISPLIWHVQLSGIWYEIELSRTPKYSYGYDIPMENIFECLQNYSWDNNNKWKIVTKKQLSSKALKKYKLVNTPSKYKESQYG